MAPHGRAHSNGAPPKTPVKTNGTSDHSRAPPTASYASKHEIAPHFIGGNNLAAAPPSKVKSFVEDHDGHTVITRVGD